MLALTACSGEARSNASTSTEDAGSFDFDESTPLGEVIPAEARETAPGFGGELLDGTEFDSESLAGDITVMNFWGSWCAPCRVETPEFQAVYEDVKDDGVQFLGVDVKDDRQLAEAFLEGVGAEYPSLFDPRGEVALAFRGFPANVVPTTILLDGAGQVAAVYVAVVPESELRRALDTLKAEEPPR
ncbi:Thiol-disulfide isomerase or thioredoxin [Blastococcus aurantiacus]|uniref:Thiol-disulfide isomerase or thioredoxin n=2 Tax=Blastococcus aurantiacus TaxID=1550231 RepID=A0A1G7R9K2_9ACTN|nr:Thiol-disulfide isomerase or thioredoxin [Blastococcus aurantiacus]